MYNKLPVQLQGLIKGSFFVYYDDKHIRQMIRSGLASEYIESYSSITSS